MASTFLGIDIAKDKFDVLFLKEDRFWHHKFPNNPAGFQNLLHWLSKQKPTDLHTCLEATSTYGLALATFLYDKGYKVSLVNPAQIKYFAQSELKRTKTDKVDAGVIARFCRAMQPDLWKPEPPEISQLKALVRRLDNLKNMRVEEKNRLQVPEQPEMVLASIRAILEVLDAEISSLERQIKEHLRHHPKLREQQDLLKTIPGIGDTTANVILAELGDMAKYGSARQVGAQAGLVPCHKVSGSSVHGKSVLSKKGSARLRKALYWPAITALRTNPAFREFAQRQRALGKANLQIIAAAMRKLLHLAYGILKGQRPFNPNYAPERT